VGKEMESMQAEGAAFNPRGEGGADIDKMTESMLQGMLGSTPGAQQPGGYDAVINSNEDLKFIVDTLRQHGHAIPYVAKWLDNTVKQMVQELNDLLAKTFEVEDDQVGTAGPEGPPGA
jgi:hypothetical protein